MSGLHLPSSRFAERAATMFVVLVVVLVCQGSLPVQANTSFLFNKFNGSSLDLFGNVSIRSNAICLTNQSQRIVGRALYPQAVRMKDPGSMDASVSFSTTFVFSMVPPSDPSKAGDGITFIITPHKDPLGILEAPFFGLFNLSSIGQSYNHLFIVEFDTFRNPEYQDINNNHVGVNVNTLTSIKSVPATYWNGNEFRDLDLNSGQNIQAWIDYRHLQKQLNVTIAPAGSPRPPRPLITLENMNLSIVEEEMYVGFSAATGLFIEDHCILAWSFNTNGPAPTLDVSHLPSFLVHNDKTSHLGLIAGMVSLTVLLLILAVGALIWFKIQRRKQRYLIEEWEVEYWPHRYRYKDLHAATKGFRDEQVLGSGGFGKVYKGVISSNGLEVAVKSIFKETSEGIKEFIAEISSLGRLQHRNLVQIRGYCRQEKQLFIVYDYMPNGSLDKMLFGNPRTVLGWSQRYRILKDVAAGLLYLHEEWQQRVVHRDIKPSNVLLDSELNGRLGDFGLARLYEHNENPHTTRVVGTLGYIAPEVVRTGKATPSSDVYSFGVLMLEVASGRHPVDTSLHAAQIVLVEWVQELYANGILIDAADPNLGGHYVRDEMETVLKLGMLCCNPQEERRLGIKQILKILEGDATLPGPLPFSFLSSQPSASPSTWKGSYSRSTDSTNHASSSRSLDGR